MDYFWSFCCPFLPYIKSSIFVLHHSTQRTQRLCVHFKDCLFSEKVLGFSHARLFPENLFRESSPHSRGHTLGGKRGVAGTRFQGEDEEGVSRGWTDRGSHFNILIPARLLPPPWKGNFQGGSLETAVGGGGGVLETGK